MSVAALQYHEFANQVAQEERVYTFAADGELLVFPVRDCEVVPFWSSQSRLETVQSRHPKHDAQYAVTALTLAEFWEWLRQLEDDGILIGVNSSGERLVGYDAPVSDLRTLLTHRERALGNELSPDHS